MKLLEIFSNTNEGVVGNIPDGGVPDDDLDNVVGPEHVPVQSLHVAVGDGQVGDLDLGGLSQTNSHTCYNTFIMK